MDIELEVVGQRLKSLRTAAGLRLSDLAAATGYTTGYISQIERGATLPSLTAMATLALALGVEISTFIEAPNPPQMTVTRAGEHHELRLGEGMTYWIHGEIGSKRSFSITTQEMHQSDQTHRHFGERFMIVLDGAVDISFGEETHSLGAMDTIHYGANEEHSISSASSQAALVMMASSPAIF